jgi:hypothetical protein
MTEERGAYNRSGLSQPVPVPLLSPLGQALGLAVLESLSSKHVRLLAQAEAEPGALLTLAPGPGHPLAGQRLSFRVTRCEALPRGGHRVGGAFARRLTEVEVQALAGS